MGSSVSLSNASISSLAEKIADARRLYGADSTYVIGLLAGLDLVLDAGDSERLKRQVRERLIEIESGKAAPPTPTPSTPSKPSEAPPATEATESGLTENSWIKGSVKWFNNDKGYGFISTASDTDVFVHWRDITSWDRSLGQGDEVEFMVTKTAKGFQAVNVMKKERGDAPPDPSGDPSDAQSEQEPAGQSETSEPASDAETGALASTSGDADGTEPTPEAEVPGSDSTDAPTTTPACVEAVSTGSADDTETTAEGAGGGGGEEQQEPSKTGDAGAEASESSDQTLKVE